MDSEQYIFADKAPYPQIRAEKVNLVYAREMQKNMGSCGSEMSAVTTYFYNSMMVKAGYDEVADCFHHIMIVEMHHLDIFGQLAWQLGADPRLWSYEDGAQIYWSPSCNHYGKCLEEIFRNAIRAEKEAVKHYRQQREEIKDGCVVENLDRIILDEIHHINTFQALLRKYCSRR